MLVFTVKVLRTKHLRKDVDSHRPPVAGPVWFATPAAIDYALNAGTFRVKVPTLLHTNGNPVRDEFGNPRLNDEGKEVFQRAPIWLDADYLLGPEAGHANWTGQSGLATKTSHALFLISGIFQTMRENSESVAALMFNVKGPDLLWLDKPARPPAGLEAMYEEHGGRGLSEEDEAAYAALGIRPEAFENLRIFAPFRPGMAPEPGANYQVLLDGLSRDTIRVQLNTERYARTEAHVVHPILWDAGRLLSMPHKFFDRMDLDDKMYGLIYDLRDEDIRSLAQLEARLENILVEMTEEGADQTWKGHHRYSIQKLRNRVRSLDHKFGGLLGTGQVMQGDAPSASGPFVDQEMRVIDISQCKTNVQEVLVSTIVGEIWRLAEDGELGVKKLIIFVDELNKYAPGGGEGALQDTLVDIAARGRHLNVVLFGAQQFRSKVDDEILGNCGTAFYGRIGDEEIVNAAYRSLSETTKAELLGLPKGRLLVRHAHFRAPLLGAFPMPPTVPGIVGQRVFNDEGVIASQHPGDVIWAVLSRIMGNRALSREELRMEADGLDPEEVLVLAQKIEGMSRRGLKQGMDPNRMARNGLQQIRQQYGARG
jgi:hypothetical protein